MSQCAAILYMLEHREPVTPLTAFKRCGTLALHSRVAELRARGFDVRCTMRYDKRNRKCGEYFLENQPRKGKTMDLHAPTPAQQAAFRLYASAKPETHEKGAEFTADNIGRVAPAVTALRKSKIRSMFRAGASLRQMAEATKISTHMVRRHLKSMGLK